MTRYVNPFDYVIFAVFGAARIVDGDGVWSTLLILAVIAILVPITRYTFDRLAE